MEAYKRKILYVEGSHFKSFIEWPLLEKKRKDIFDLVVQHASTKNKFKEPRFFTGELETIFAYQIIRNQDEDLVSKIQNLTPITKGSVEALFN